jgi:hypothetical protein
MQRAEVSVEVCYVEEQGKSSEKKKTTSKKKRSKKSQTTKKRQDLVVSDWETPVSEWEDEDELNASQYLQGSDVDPTLVRKRRVEETSPGIEIGNEPTTKRPRTSGYKWTKVCAHCADRYLLICKCS